MIGRSMKQTGGGPMLPPLSAAEDMMVDQLEGRPMAHGLVDGIDTDGICRIFHDRFISLNAFIWVVRLMFTVAVYYYYQTCILFKDFQ